jgi:hypothetical protein
MNAGRRFKIDDTEQVRPHIRLCHQILSEALAAGFTSVELTAVPGTVPAARARHEGTWKSFMAFPPPVYGQLVEYFKQMARVASDAPAAEGTILVRAAGRDAAVVLRSRRNDQGVEELILDFPATSVGQAAT